MFASAAASVQRKRRRPALACDRCRRRKIKCDRKLPCSHCVRTGFGPSCTYVTSDQIGATVVREPDESIQDSSSNSQYTGYGDCNISPTFSIGSTSAENELHENFWDLYALPTGDTCSQGPVSSVIDYPDSSIGAQALQQRVRQLEQKLASVSKAEASKNDQASAASQDNERVKGRMWQRSLLGRSHWSSSVINFHTNKSIPQTVFQKKGSALNISFQECQHLSRAIRHNYYQAQISLSPNPRDNLPARETCDALIRVYLREFECVFRIVHVPTFERDYEEFWNDTRSINKTYLMQLQLILAIGACLSKEPEESDISDLQLRCSHWIQSAQQWLTLPFKRSYLGIPGIQVHCLLLLARMVTSFEPDLVSISAGSLMRAALQMKLHRDPSHFSNMSFFEGEIRRRLWSTICEILLQSSMDSGSPPLIACDDFDCAAPFNLDDNQIDEAHGTASNAKPMNVFTQTSVQVSLMRSLPVRLKVAKALNGINSELTYTETLHLGEEITVACRSNTRLFQAFRTDQAELTPFHIKILDLLTRRFLLSLHLPFAMNARQSYEYYLSRKICFETAVSLLSSPSHSDLSSSSQTAITSDKVFARLKLFSSGPFYDPLLMSAIVVGQELLSMSQGDAYSCQSLFSFSDTPLLSGDKARMDLRTIFLDCVGTDASRLETGGESSIQSHILLSCIEAQLEASDTGNSEEEIILASVLETLQTCQTNLKERLHKISRQLLGPSPHQQLNTNAEPHHLDSINFDSEDGLIREIGDDIGFDEWIESAGLDNQTPGSSQSLFDTNVCEASLDLSNVLSLFVSMNRLASR